MESRELTTEQGIALATRGAFATEDGRNIVHCMGSFTGADWDLEAVVSEIRLSSAVHWAPHFLGHHLRVRGRTATWHFDVGESPDLTEVPS